MRPMPPSGSACRSGAPSRVEDERGGVQDWRRRLRAASFVVALAEKSIAPFLVPAHRTGHDHFGHPALGRVSRAAFAGGVSRIPFGRSVQRPLERPECCGGLLGSRQSPSPRLVRAHPEPGPLPSTGVTQLPRYYGPLRRLPRPSPEGTGAGSPRPRDRPPVLPVPACVRAAPTTPASRTIFRCRCIRSPAAAFVQ
jgi:hypothetical protein